MFDGSILYPPVEYDPSETLFAAHGSVSVQRTNKNSATKCSIEVSRAQICVRAITGVELGTIKSRLSRGRGRLRQALRGAPGGGELFARYHRRYEKGVDEPG